MEGEKQAHMRANSLFQQLERPIVGIPLSDETRRKEFGMKEPVVQQIRKSREALEEMGRQRYTSEEDLRVFGLHLAYQINQNLGNGIYADSIIIKAKYEPPAPHETLATMSFTAYFMLAGEGAAPQLEVFGLRFELTPELLHDIYKPVRWIAGRVIFGTNAAMGDFFYRSCNDRNTTEDINETHSYAYIYLPLELASELRG